MQNDLAFVFPGQGSQSVGMLADMAKHFPLVQETFNQASDILGYDLWSLTQKGPEEELNKTIVTQPALLVASYAIWKIWLQLDGNIPAYVAGHSLGEYTALLCADAIDFTTAVKLVAQRAHLMQEAVPPNMGAMAAIVGLDDDTVNQICFDAAEGEIVSPANYNSIGQVVIGGHKAAVERAMQLAEQAGAKLVVKINMSVPSHCLLIKTAADKMAVYLKSVQIRKPSISLINNVDAEIYIEENLIKDALVRQLYNPVRWVDIIRSMQQKGITKIVECGPGKVLTGLNKRIDRSLNNYPIGEPTGLNTALGR